MAFDYDFSGWATKANLECADGRVIMPNAFKANDGQTVPLVWNHKHDTPDNVLGHALLTNQDDGVYAYCKFNDTPSGQNAKSLVQHGDVTALSIYANKLQQRGCYVNHGAIREVSLVLAGANPEALIDNVIAHGADLDEDSIFFIGGDIELYHSDDYEEYDDEEEDEEEIEEMYDEYGNFIGYYDEDGEFQHSDEDYDDEDDETIADVIDTMNEKQKEALYIVVGQALEEGDDDDDEEGDEEMKHNVFDQDVMYQDTYLSHADQAEILGLAKSSNVGSLQEAISMYADNNFLAHGIDDIESLFPEYQDVRPGAPERITRDLGWVSKVMNGVHKSPISRIRTRQADVRGTDLTAYGYKKGDKKVVPGNIKLLKRTTDPQTVYRKDALERDDIIDITDFDVVSYQYQVMKENLEEEIALAIMVGDGREDGADYKIDETHIRSIWHDDDLYTIHYDVDLEAAKKELQGTGTGTSFGENYIYAEAIINAALYSRENYKGSGSLTFYCTPHILNVMLLARDMNGRRIYSSKTDLAAALNVNEIQTVEQFNNLTRTAGEGASAKTKKLLGIFVNLDDYQVGSTKGGEITKFNQFDIDFNQEKYLIETRISGALTRVYSAIALEEDVTVAG